MYVLLFYSTLSIALVIHLSIFFIINYKNLKRNNIDYFTHDTPKERLKESLALKFTSIEIKVNWLSYLAGLSTLTGLLGTVLGIYQAFENMKLFKQASAEVFAGGIGVALLTTIYGLTIAIFSMMFYYLFTSLVDDLDAKISFMLNLNS
jgi:biopolymer transport protein ExbB/TolQ